MKQIISLGAGTDTRWFRLRAQRKHQNVIYHEFDFATVLATKYRTVINHEIFATNGANEILFPEPRAANAASLNPDAEWGYVRQVPGTEDMLETAYCCHPLDIRNLSNPEQQPRSFRGLRTDIPTLIISECCLCYLEVETSRNVLRWFADRITSLGIVLYEPIRVDDSFGQMMVANLAARNITMPSLNTYKTLDDQKARLGELGFKVEGQEGGQEAETVENIWAQWIPASEKRRVDMLEGLDEVEEWQMLASHYAIVWGWKGSSGWGGWSRLREETKR